MLPIGQGQIFIGQLQHIGHPGRQIGGCNRQARAVEGSNGFSICCNGGVASHRVDGNALHRVLLGFTRKAGLV